MNFNMLSSSSPIDCAVQINFSSDPVDKGWELFYCKRYQSEEIILGKFHVIEVNVNTMPIQSGINRALRQISSHSWYHSLTNCNRKSAF